jgi:hypothetical protein
MKFQKAAAHRIYNIVLNILYIIVFILLIESFGLGRGILITLLIILLPILWRVYKQREQYIDLMRQIEYNVFGKPLDKQYWQKGELAKKKIKIVWSKPEAKK